MDKQAERITRVARPLLAHSQEGWTINKLAERLHMSIGSVQQTIDLLRESGYVVNLADGRVALTDDTVRREAFMEALEDLRPIGKSIRGSIKFQQLLDCLDQAEKVWGDDRQVLLQDAAKLIEQLEECQNDSMVIRCPDEFSEYDRGCLHLERRRYEQLLRGNFTVPDLLRFYREQFANREDASLSDIKKRRWEGAK